MAGNEGEGRLRKRWRKIKTSSQFRNVLAFLIFVAISILFWFILALNDSVTKTVSVRLNIENVPDTVTFITDPPAEIHLTLRDKGTNILRSGMLKDPTLNINFRDWSHDGLFRLSRQDLSAVLKGAFGSGMTIASTSLDSIRCYYTDSPGKRVPVVVKANVTASSGNVIVGDPVPLDRFVRIYSFGDEVDTVSRVYTEVLKKRNVSQTSEYEVKLQPVRGVRIVPSKVHIRLNVEPLVHKEGYAQIVARGVPPGESLLLFPNRVPVSYYVPMSKFNEGDISLTVSVDYADTKAYSSNKIPVKVSDVPRFVVNPEIHADSVEYTLVRKQK